MMSSSMVVYFAGDRLRAMFDQQANDLEVAALGGEMQRERVVALVADVRVGAAIEKGAGRWRVLLAEVQCRAADPSCPSRTPRSLMMFGAEFERRGQSVDVAVVGGAQEDLDRLVARRAGGLEPLGGGLERGPAGQAVLESEGVLDVAQSRIRGGTRPRARQADERVRLLRAQILQPALGFLAEMFDGSTRSKRTRHETPSFRYARRPLNDGPEEGSWLTDEPAGWEVPCRGQEAPQSALPGSVRQGARGVNRQRVLSLESDPRIRCAPC